MMTTSITTSTSTTYDNDDDEELMRVFEELRSDMKASHLENTTSNSSCSSMLTNGEDGLVRVYEDLRNDLREAICHSIPFLEDIDERDKSKFLKACCAEMESRQSMMKLKQALDKATKEKNAMDKVVLDGMQDELKASEAYVTAAEHNTYCASEPILTRLFGEFGYGEVGADINNNKNNKNNKKNNKNNNGRNRAYKILSNGSMDEMFAPFILITEATPRALAAFSNNGELLEEKFLIDELLNNPTLMKQMLVAGGAKHGNYGQAMRIFTKIQQCSQHASEPNSIFYNLALGTSLEFAATPIPPTTTTTDTTTVVDGANNNNNKKRNKSSSSSSSATMTIADGAITIFDTNIPIDPVERYLHYERAYLNGELDPAFPNMSPWECRWITNSDATNEQLQWGREMIRNYRPDLVFTKDYAWRYCQLVKTDVRYKTPNWTSTPRTYQQLLAGGGKCGPRAWFGRFIARCFGIPTWGIRQPGHAAMSHWTPNGWTICLGGGSRENRWGGWHQSSWENRNAYDFLMEAEARMSSEYDYMKVLRLQWIGSALGENKKCDNIFYLSCSFWKALANMQKKELALSISIFRTQEKLDLEEESHRAWLRRAGGNDSKDTDSVSSSSLKIRPIPIEHIINDGDGSSRSRPDGRTAGNGNTNTAKDHRTIIIPAATCTTPKKSNAQVIFMRSFDTKNKNMDHKYTGSYMQVHVKEDCVLEYNLRITNDQQQDQDQHEHHHRRRRGGRGRGRGCGIDDDTYDDNDDDDCGSCTYLLTARVTTVISDQEPFQICITTRDGQSSTASIPIPYTMGQWKMTDPVTITLQQGMNTLLVSRPKNNSHGVSIKYFKLDPC